MAHKLPQVFIASSTEGLGQAEAIKAQLEPTLECTIWREGVFGLSSYTLIDLESQTKKMDYGVFIFTPDDIVHMRGKEYDTVRDNVLFELGIFIGRLGRESCYIVMPKGTERSHIPTDLSGVHVGYYDPNGHGGNLRAAMGTVVYDIKQAIASQEEAAEDVLKSEMYTVAAKLVVKKGGEAVPVDTLGCDTILNKLPAMVDAISRQIYYEEVVTRITITPNADGTIFEQKICHEEVLYTPNKEYNSSKAVSWYESKENRDAVHCNRLILDGVDVTDRFNQSRKYTERSAESFFNCWGACYDPIEYEGQGRRHEIIQEMSSRKHVRLVYVATARRITPVKKYEISILINGPYADKWTIEYNSFATFDYASSPEKGKCRKKYHTLQNVQINYDDWVLPGTGYMYVIRPKLSNDERRIIGDDGT